MPKISEEKLEARKEEIIEACALLYESKSFKEITLSDIGKATSFSRPSIYNYFQTKEEIFLALLQKEYDSWGEDLNAILNENSSLSIEDFSDKLAISLENRARLLKIISMNIYDMEASSRLEKLVEFKRSYKTSLEHLRKCIEKFFPEKDAESFIIAFLPFMFGIYPYTHATPKQVEALKQAGLEYSQASIYQISFSCIKNLLS